MRLGYRMQLNGFGYDTAVAVTEIGHIQLGAEQTEPLSAAARNVSRTCEETVPVVKVTGGRELSL